MEKEMKVGEILPFGFRRIQCVEAVKGCSGCCGNYADCIIVGDVLGSCDADEREDGKSVIFKIVEE